MKKKLNYLVVLFMILFMAGCTNGEVASNIDGKGTASPKEETVSEVGDKPAATETSIQSKEELFAGYKLIEVDGGDLSGHREPNVVVDIGFGDREYWAFTNEYGQLVRVVAAEIILQDDRNEPVLPSGRYYSDEAKVPGVERPDLDEGHVIADALGGVSNAYNITPQNSVLNRHGDQAYMEKMIRDAGGATDFEAIITYPNTKTQIPSSYQYSYTIKGQRIVEKFDNVDPDKANAERGLTGSKPAGSNGATGANGASGSNGASGANGSSGSNSSNGTNGSNTNRDISSIDTDGNGQVTIKEAKAAGFKMPITRDHWLYKYMDDRDGDGMVGE